jgi:hypothetical protein
VKYYLISEDKKPKDEFELRSKIQRGIAKKSLRRIDKGEDAPKYNKDAMEKAIRSMFPVKKNSDSVNENFLRRLGTAINKKFNIVADPETSKKLSKTDTAITKTQAQRNEYLNRLKAGETETQATNNVVTNQKPKKNR